MKSISDILLPADLRYTNEHIWIRQEADSSLFVGITDYAQEQLGEIVFVDLPEVDSILSTGDEFGTVESLKSVNPLFMPVTGRIIEINSSLESTPTLVNYDCYGKGWMLRVCPDNDEDIKNMLKNESYLSILKYV